MAYNRKNLLRRMIDVQNLVISFPEGTTQEYIFLEHVKPQYHISRATFYGWLGTNAKKQLKELEQTDKMQMSLF